MLNKTTHLFMLRNLQMTNYIDANRFHAHRTINTCPTRTPGLLKARRHPHPAEFSRNWARRRGLAPRPGALTDTHRRPPGSVPRGSRPQDESKSTAELEPRALGRTAAARSLPAPLGPVVLKGSCLQADEAAPSRFHFLP